MGPGSATRGRGGLDEPDLLPAAALAGGRNRHQSLPLLLPTLGWVVAAVVAAQALFRWEPRG